MVRNSATTVGLITCPLLVEFGGASHSVSLGKYDQLEGSYKKNNLPINEISDLHAYVVGAKITSLEATTFYIWCGAHFHRLCINLDYENC